MKNNILKKTLYGIFARLLNPCVPVKRKTWVFGADYGKSYREGSKYLLEYMLENHLDYDCCFVTQSREVFVQLKAAGVPCVMNVSLRGILKVARAEWVFTTHILTDVLYAYRKKGRHAVYLGHGQSMKIAYFALVKSDYKTRTGQAGNEGFSRKAKTFIGKRLGWFTGDMRFEDLDFGVATSDFLKKWVEIDFDRKTEVKVLGMPRNDVLFMPNRIGREKWVDGLDGKFVVTYMPTHRLYGKGKVSPTPFENMPAAQEWMRRNNVVLVVKNHPNMLRQFGEGQWQPYESDCIRDITASAIDPMVAVYHSDVLVTDYSSVWMDYLLLRRPLIFYIYDDFAKNDVGFYFDPVKENAGLACYSERELLDAIVKIKADYDAMRPSDAVVRKFHKYPDGKSCERYFNEVARIDGNGK